MVKSLNSGTWENMSRFQTRDIKRSLKVLMKVTLQGWPDDKSSVSVLALLFYNQRDALTVENGIIFRSKRVVITTRLRE